jgi:polyhydroxyalkanoate synthesis regulator protein
MTEAMTEARKSLTIKRHANEQRFDPAAAACLTHDGLAQRLRDDEDFVIIESETGEDISGAVPKQIIVERGRHG